MDEISDTKTRLWESTGKSSALKNVPPEALGQALQTLIVTREPEDFRSIKCILGSTLAWNANPLKEPSANHKLKWTLRYVTDVEIPDEAGPAKEAKKEETVKGNSMWINLEDLKKRMNTSLNGLKNSLTTTKSARNLSYLVFISLTSLVPANPPYPCEYKEIRKKSYGTIEFRISCKGKEEYNSIPKANQQVRWSMGMGR